MTSWKAQLQVPRDDAAIAESILEAHEVAGMAPSIAAFADADDPSIYVVEAYFEGQPNAEILRDAVATAMGDAVSATLSVEEMPETDWVSLSQSMLPPVTAGRFHVYGSHAADTLKPGQTGLLIEAGQAFGTGRHETTQGCLETLDQLADVFPISHALDVGTGSGVLALAIVKAWGVPVVMSDIDPIATATASENAVVNGVAVLDELKGQGTLPITAAGMADAAIRRHAPYPLIIANILAEPLCILAPDITAAAADDGKIILSGLLNAQADSVLAAYKACGWGEEKRVTVGDWPTLTLRKG